MLALLASCSSPSSPLLLRSTRRSGGVAGASSVYPPPVAAVSCSASTAGLERISSPSASHYAVLGIPLGATTPEIKSAYRRLARMCHPDVVVGGSRDERRRETCEGEFIRINSAYATLSDPDKRAAYDIKMFAQRLRPISSFSSRRRQAVCGFPGRRNWESDQCW